MSFLVVSDRFKNMWMICVIFVVFLHVSVGLLNFVTETQQQQNIIHATTTLSQARYLLASTSSGELVFFAGGYNSTGPSDRVDIYNVTSGSWTTFTLSIPRYDLAATSSQNLVFFGGGWNVTTFYDRVDIYNTLNGSWSTATLSQPRCCLAATSVGNFVLFGGGYNSTGPSNVVDVFDVTSNRWTTANLSQARYYLASTSVDNRYALFGGGYNGSGPSNVVDIFDSLRGMWNTTTLSQYRAFLAATSLGHLAFFGGGSLETNGKISKFSNVVDIFNSTSQTWSTSTLSQARVLLASSSIGEIVAFGGGTPDGNTASSVVDLFNVTSNTWFIVNLSQPRALLASSSSNNKILFGGGLSNTGLSNIVDIIEISLPISQSPTPTSLSQNDTTTTSSDLITGVVIGVTFGILSLLIGLNVIVLILIRKRKQQQQQQQQTEVSMNSNKQPKKPDNNTIQISKSVLKYSQIAFNEIVVEKEIGGGSFGTVFVGKWNNGKVALKFCRNKENIKNFMKECKVMIELPPHPNVVQMFGVSLDGPQPIIVLEYCDGGSLDKLLLNSEVKLSDERKIELVRGIASGMFHLHKHNIVHRDLAARNILLSSNGDPKISDFGMSRILQEREEGKTYSNIGPIRWMAPESIGQRIYSKQSDVWMFGIVVWEIVAQKEPHTDVDPVDVGALIRDEGLTPKIPQDCPPILREVMEMCWKKDPNQRPNFEAICTFLSYSNKGVVIST